MPKDRKQPNISTERFLKALENTQKMIEDSVSKAEVAELMSEVIQSVKVSGDRLDGKVAKNKDSIDSIFSTLTGNLQRLETKVNNLISANDKKNTDLLNSAVKQLSQEVNSVRESIPDYTERFTELEGQIPELPEQLLGEDMRNALEALPKGDKLAIEAIEDLPETLKELEDKIIRSNRGVGGVTNLRIIQAFKTILKTEAPVGAINGVNKTYTLSQPIFAIFSMSINGETIAQLPNYTISDKSFTFATALPAAYSGKDFEVKYI